MSQQLQGASALTAAFTRGILAIGSTTSQFSTGAAIVFCINGRFFVTNKAATATQAYVIEPNTGIDPKAPNAFQPVPAGKACAFAVMLDSAGAFTVAQGPIVENGDLCPVPAAPAGKCLVGAIKVRNGSSADWVPGTTAHNAANITTTYFDFAQHPGAPI